MNKHAFHLKIWVSLSSLSSVSQSSHRLCFSQSLSQTRFDLANKLSGDAAQKTQLIPGMEPGKQSPSRKNDLGEVLESRDSLVKFGPIHCQTTSSEHQFDSI